jgi:hypothetical protein
MQSWYVKFAALMLALLLPLQGVAAVLTPALCSTQEHHQDAGTHAHADGNSADHGHDSAGGKMDYSGHLCCNLAFTVVFAVPAFALEPGSSVYQARASATPPPFVPERLQRPPRT